MRKVTQTLLTVVAIMFTTVLMAQSTITGTVIDADLNSPLPGANVVEKGTSNGVSTDFDGKFSLMTQATSGTIEVSYVGYGTITLAFNGSADLGNIMLSPDNSLGEIVITGVVDVAIDRKTPVAVSTIKASEISLKVGNQEFPEIMNNTPGVYVTKTSGGYGDSSVRLRGFDQRNTAFLINGQPVNDMENGWVYWSNWQGLSDVASGIQIQRGLGASRLAVPSVGGTVSIFTRSSQKDQGGSVSQIIGNDAYTKTTAAYNTGKNDKGWSSSYLLSKWSGDGYIDFTKGSGWTYFFAVGYAPEGSKHSFDFSFLGAGQWHHQRSSWVSIRDYQNFGDSGIDRRWNTNGGYLNGEEFNMRRNFYNKPLATFNWDWQISESVKLATSLYGSAGRGGGTGPRGQNFRNADIDLYPFNIDLTEHLTNRGRGAAARNADGSINFDYVVNHNRTTTLPYTGDLGRGDFQGLLIGSNGFRDDNVNREVLVRRASMNSHDWVGAISSLDIDAGNMRYSIGIDLRDYTGYHYRALNNLMGLDAYYSTGNQNNAGQIIETTIDADPFKKTGLKGAKIDYYNVGYVGWQGVNGLAEYSSDSNNFTAVLQGGLSNQSFQREDLFDSPTNPLSKKKNVGGGYVKGGANYNISDASNVFFNAGYISRQPNFDAVFPNFANDVNPDLQNEKITSVEVGYGLRLPSFSMNVNVYSTKWGNRFVSRGFTNSGGTSGTAQFKDINELHNGFELEANYKATSDLRINGMLSVGDWKYTKDFSSTLFDDTNTQIGTGTLYTKDAKIGNAAQFTSYLAVNYSLGDHFNFDLGWRNAGNLYADYSVTDSAFLDPNNNGAIKLPSYNLVDLGATYRFDLFGKDSYLRLNINNLFDEVYISESNTNIYADGSNPTWKGVDVRNSVWFGFGTTWNFTFKMNL
ncbi:TonB-dependent receptor [Gaetbulibacter aestuarii]|uniref:TonB-dependent receptor n=1 Tax=Gaetbulibacter aestuarii TaxID=1502358 RepID=A0ABW7MWX0_9FLAO